MVIDLVAKPSTWMSYGDRIADMRRQGHTLQEIGNAVGVTKERVRQILEEHYGTIKPVVYTEEGTARQIGCSKSTLAGFRQKGLVTPRHYNWLWLYDTNDIVKAKQLMDVHRQQKSPVALKCEQCGKEFELMKHKYNARLRGRKVSFFFCSRRCCGKYLGTHYGWGKTKKGDNMTDFSKVCWSCGKAKMKPDGMGFICAYCGAKARIFELKKGYMSHCTGCGTLTFFRSPDLLERVRLGGNLCPHHLEPKPCPGGHTTWCPVCRVRTFYRDSKEENHERS